MRVYQSLCVLDSGATLAEGPHWWSERQLLIWVDIESSLIGLYNPATSENHFINTYCPVGCVVPTNKGKLVAATSDGFKLINPDSGEIIHLHDPEKHLSDNRFNDGKCDPWGRFWAGSFNYNSTPKSASLWRLGPDFKSELMLDSLSISNGLAWSLDAKYLYHIDTPTFQVMKFPLSLVFHTNLL